MRGQVVDDFAAENSTSGGSSDTDANVLHANADRLAVVDGGDDGDARAEVAEHRASIAGVGREPRVPLAHRRPPTTSDVVSAAANTSGPPWARSE